MERALSLIQNFLDPSFIGQASDKEVYEMGEELKSITGHPKPLDVLFHTFYEEDLEDGLILTPEFLLDFMVRKQSEIDPQGGS
ncbi:hypothetical protein [Deinococcus multiflagellatus]|uniref:Uncharacterized protein n=1 Tax=Deinococcus multiflagellatus TaxID=1656887 RepID=A0ABW1ZK33_9DEIO|nr:hypothetical protein [Deinococcus multiflagellatus]MBZ9713185.1 hypothetical protein [Deinococcus multiflagellatus]